MGRTRRRADRIVASHSTGGEIDRTRPLCPYPQVGKSDGKGSIDEEKSSSAWPRCRPRISYFGSANATRLPPAGRPDFPPPAE